MAETYVTKGFQTLQQPQTDTAPAATSGAPTVTSDAPAAPVQTGGENYQTPGFKKSFGGGADGGGQGGDSGGGQPATGGSWQDWNSVAANESSMGTLPGLRAQAEAARQRLSPSMAASADFVGGVLSPTQLLNRVPVVGPAAAGALHEGIKSAVTNWTPDESWGTYLKNVGEDTALGAGFGYGGGVLAGQAPRFFGDATREMVKGLPAGFVGLHAFQMGQDIAHHMGHAAEVLGLYGGMSKLGNWAGKQVEDLGSSPYVQQAIKSLTLGAGSAARQQVPGPLDQLIWPGP
jgi:hypothetical protein